MLKSILAGAVALGALGLGAANAANPYTFALAPKNTNNPFFGQALKGCKNAEKELNGATKCLNIGPGEHGGGDEEAQIVADLITKGADGIAVSPADAAAMANALKGAGAKPAAGRQESGRDIRRRQQFRDRRQPRQDRSADQAEGARNLHPVRRRGGGQPQ